MKIAFLISSMNAGGAERVAATLCNAWARAGHQVHLIPCFSGTLEGSFYALDPAVTLTFLAQRLPSSKLKARLSKPRHLKHLIQEINPDVVVSFLTNVNITALLALNHTKYPVIVCERTNPVRGQNISRILKFLRKRLYPKAQAVMLQTEQAAQDFRAVMPKLQKVAVIPNPLSEEVTAAAGLAMQRRAEEPPPATFSADQFVKAVHDGEPDLTAVGSSIGEPAGRTGRSVAADPSDSVPVTSTQQPQPKKILIAVGRLVPIKRFSLLIRVFSRLRNHHSDWTLHIYGDGPLKPELEKQIEERGMQNIIFLKGSSKDIPQRMLEADAFAMTSALEGFPNVLLEAMALGLPAICMDCPSGPAELSDYGRLARLVRDGDEASFHYALDELLGDPVMRSELGRTGQAHTLENYTLEAVLEQWNKLFSELKDKRC